MLTSRHYWLQETGTSFNITPKKGGSFTPSKMLLMQRERRMNMLTPEQGSKMFNADIETGKILNEWSFQKDGVDIDIKDISNDTRAAGLDDRDTFLGLGGNRCAGLSITFAFQMNPPCHGLCGLQDGQALLACVPAPQLVGRSIYSIMLSARVHGRSEWICMHSLQRHQ